MASLPLLLGVHQDDEGKAAMLAVWRQAADAHGHDPSVAAHTAAVIIHVADTRAEATAQVRAAMPAWLEQGVGEYVRLTPSAAPPRDPHAYVERLLSIHPVGTPEDCAERLRATAARTGIGRFLLMVEVAGDHDAATGTITRVGAEVAPLLNGVNVSAGTCHHPVPGRGPRNIREHPAVHGVPPVSAFRVLWLVSVRVAFVPCADGRPGRRSFPQQTPNERPVDAEPFPRRAAFLR